MIRLSLIALALSPTIALAQTPPRAKVPPVQLVQGPQRAPLSVEGRAIQARIYGAQDPQLAQWNSDLAALRAQRMAMTEAPPVDLDQLDALLRKEELLRALSEADRNVVLQNMNISAKKPVAAIAR